MTLIEQINIAVNSGELPKWFTTANIKEWVNSNNITKSNGSVYSENSINSILSNSDKKNKPTTNLNKKVLESILNNKVKEYHFIN